jgi:GT2 family glycosyltransferase
LSEKVPVKADLRAVVLAYGAGGEFVPLLDSLTREGLPAERILLVHNPSTPGQQLPAAVDCEVVSASHNLGYAAGMNLGIERQRQRGCELLLVLTHDARLRAGALRELLAAVERNPEFGALGPALMFTGTDAPFSYGGETRFDGSVRHRKVAPPVVQGIATCEWIDGGTMLIREEVLARTGGFDERLWGYCEDADLCLRISRCGFRVGVVVDAVADQAPGGAKRPGPWAYLLTRNGIAYAQRFAGRRGAAAAIAKAAGALLLELMRTAARATGLRPGSPGERWVVAVGTLRGIVDFARGRWGPPPPSLPGMGDLGNATAGPGAGGDGG